MTAVWLNGGGVQISEKFSALRPDDDDDDDDDDDNDDDDDSRSRLPDLVRQQMLILPPPSSSLPFQSPWSSQQLFRRENVDTVVFRSSGPKSNGNLIPTNMT